MISEGITPEFADTESMDSGMENALAQFHIQRLHEASNDDLPAFIAEAKEHCASMSPDSMVDELRSVIEMYENFERSDGV